MGKYFGREPRYSREEIERQAQEAIDARVSLGRPPAEEWKPVEARLAELDRSTAARAVLAAQQPFRIHRVRLSQPPVPADRPRRPVGARAD